MLDWIASRKARNISAGALLTMFVDASTLLRLIRALGPELTGFGISDALQDPTMELHDGNGNLLLANDNWKDSQQAAIQATGLAPGDDREPAILTTLIQGNWTAIVRGKNNTTGNALVECYILPP
jgi:hypothetical protein